MAVEHYVQLEVLCSSLLMDVTLEGQAAQSCLAWGNGFGEESPDLLLEPLKRELLIQLVSIAAPFHHTLHKNLQHGPGQGFLDVLRLVWDEEKLQLRIWLACGCCSGIDRSCCLLWRRCSLGCNASTGPGSSGAFGTTAGRACKGTACDRMWLNWICWCCVLIILSGSFAARATASLAFLMGCV
eukprot:1320477-Rhodomonas_salina.1